MVTSLDERLQRLLRLTAQLSSALHASEIADIIVAEGTEAIGAQSAALWQVDAEARTLVLLGASGYGDDTLAAFQQIDLTATTLPIVAAVQSREAVWLTSPADYAVRFPDGETIARAYLPLAQSIAALPIVLDDRALGALVVRFPDEHAFDETERSYLALLALHCAQAFERTRLHATAIAARAIAEVAQERAMFLSRASAVLGSSLDYEETLRNVASLAVPKIGDWCGVELVDEDGVAKQVAVAHVDPAKVEYAREIRRRYPTPSDAPTGVPNVLRTGRSELYREISDEILVATARDAEHLRIARELQLRSVMIVPIKDRDTVVGAISLVLASDRRYSDDDLMMAEQLAERAGAAIANARLYAAAQQAVRARDDFMLTAGHELRTPLMALSLHHEALQRARDDMPIDKVRERGTKLRAQSDRIARLVEDLLDVSRISAGRVALEREELDFGEHVTAIVDRMRDELERTKTPITLAVDSIRGHWDRSRTDQIITNLLGNAAKYGRGAPIEVRVLRRAEVVDLVVADQGIGIAEEDQPRIFKRFERAASAQGYGGLGLGLWITSRLVEAHGGTIAVASRLGAGSTFTVSLPLG